jgi:hypothetical protein
MENPNGNRLAANTGAITFPGYSINDRSILLA